MVPIEHSYLLQEVSVLATFKRQEDVSNREKNNKSIEKKKAMELKLQVRNN